MNKKTKDLVLAIICIFFGIYVTAEGLNICKVASVKPYNVEKFSLSPGLLPTVLGILLIFFSLLLVFFSFREKGKSIGETAKERKDDIVNGVKGSVKNPDTYRMIIGMVIMAVFSFFLVGLRIGGFKLPFYLTGGIFMFVLLMYLGAVKWWQALIITVVTMGLITVLFQYGFRAVLP